MTAFVVAPTLRAASLSVWRRHESASGRAVSAQSPRWSAAVRKISAAEKTPLPSARANAGDLASPVIVNRDRSGENPSHVSRVGLPAFVVPCLKPAGRSFSVRLMRFAHAWSWALIARRSVSPGAASADDARIAARRAKSPTRPAVAPHIGIKG
jgi:hypothetical protein